MPEYTWIEGVKHVWIEDTTFTRRGRTYKREGHWRAVGPEEHVPNGRRRELSEEHKRRLSKSLKKAPNGRREFTERRRRVTRLPVDERIEYLEYWAKRGIPA